jgi:hypothetical protein
MTERPEEAIQRSVQTSSRRHRLLDTERPLCSERRDTYSTNWKILMLNGFVSLKRRGSQKFNMDGSHFRKYYKFPKNSSDVAFKSAAGSLMSFQLLV